MLSSLLCGKKSYTRRFGKKIYSWVNFSTIKLDEISAKRRHKYATVFSAPCERKVLDLIKGKDERRVKSVLEKYPKEERKEVKGVIIDRFKPYRKVAKEMFSECPDNSG